MNKEWINNIKKLILAALAVGLAAALSYVSDHVKPPQAIPVQSDSESATTLP